MTALLRELARAPVPESAPVLLPGECVAGRFEVVREIGRGGFATVYEARDTWLGRHIALKLVRTELPSDAPISSDEAEAAAQLAHPNIVALFDVGIHLRMPYLVLELLEGETVAERLHRVGALDAEDALAVALQVGRALAHAHERSVVHRDLKPANVFLCRDGTAKVLDFGMSWRAGRALMPGGTAAYMSPEQRRGEAEDARTDVYALGVMVRELLTGNHSELGDIPGPERPLAGLRAALDAFVDAATAEDPAARPSDGAAVVRELERIEALRRRLARRARWRRAAAVLVPFVLLAAIAVALVVTRERSAEREAVAEVSLENAATGSLAAYTHWLRGLDLSSQYQEFTAARDEYQRALDIDPQHAAAHFGLAYLAGVFGRVADRAEHQRAAVAAAVGMPDRERLLILALDAADDDRRDEAAALAGELAARFPRDKIALFHAAQALWVAGHLGQAEQLYRRALALDPAYYCATADLVRLLAERGQAQEAIAVARRTAAQKPTAPNLAVLAQTLLRAGARDEAVAWAREALRRGSTGTVMVTRGAGNVLAMAGYFDEAEAAYRALAERGEDEDERGFGLARLAELLAYRGRVAEARHACEQLGPRCAFAAPSLDWARLVSVGRDRRAAPEAVEVLSRERGVAHLAPALAFFGALDRAAVAARDLPADAPAHAYHRGLTLAAASRWSEAIPALRTFAAVPHIGRADFAVESAYILGEVLLAAGRAEEAVEALRPVDQLDFFNASALDLAANGPRALIVRARALEHLGLHTEARRDLETVLARWAPADRGLPLVDEARTIQARLAR
ncbi:MAG TPA: protein kinase [Anaeromyxobacter sp.]|nr:protein kinase [Anaeromyxobacter sp.]